MLVKPSVLEKIPFRNNHLIVSKLGNDLDDLVKRPPFIERALMSMTLSMITKGCTAGIDSIWKQIFFGVYVFHQDLLLTNATSVSPGALVCVWLEARGPAFGAISLRRARRPS